MGETQPSRLNRYRRTAATGALLVILMPVAASAHQNTIAFGNLDLSPGQARLELYVAYPDWDQPLGLDRDNDGRLTLEELRPNARAIERHLRAGIRGWNNGEACPMTVEPPGPFMRGGKAYVGSVISFECAASIQRFTLRYTLFARLHPGHQLMARIRSGKSEVTHRFLTHPRVPAEYTVVVEGPPPSRWETIAEFLALGMEHIFTGYDHILFLLALIVVGGALLDLVKVVTAFTVAHTVTLVLAALEVVSLPSGLVEAAIALSIVAVASENLLFETRSVRWRVLITFLFGLVHGFGFATILAEMEITRDALLTALVCFNGGVELGQVAIVMLIYPVLRWLRGRTFQRKAVRGVSALILLMGLWWLVERTLLVA